MNITFATDNIPLSIFIIYHYYYSVITSLCITANIARKHMAHGRYRAKCVARCWSQNRKRHCSSLFSAPSSHRNKHCSCGKVLPPPVCDTSKRSPNWLNAIETADAMWPALPHGGVSLEWRRRQQAWSWISTSTRLKGKKRLLCSWLKKRD